MDGLGGATPPRRVSYLFGAGATQGAVHYAGSARQLVMPGLIGRLMDSTNTAFAEDFSDHAGLRHLVNDVVNDETDFEHLLTFLADTPSRRYQEFAERLKRIFSAVLRRALADVRHELGERHSALYAALLDMHNVPEAGEKLVGLLTLNYDNFLEHATRAGARPKGGLPESMSRARRAATGKPRCMCSSSTVRSAGRLCGRLRSPRSARSDCGSRPEYESPRMSTRSTQSGTCERAARL